MGFSFLRELRSWEWSNLLRLTSWGFSPNSLVFRVLNFTEVANNLKFRCGFGTAKYFGLLGRLVIASLGSLLSLVVSLYRDICLVLPAGFRNDEMSLNCIFLIFMKESLVCRELIGL